MKQIIRQRLVGALVLLALAVVFWPIIFVTPQTDEPFTVNPMPPRPEIDESPLPKPVSQRSEVEANLVMPEIDEESQIAAIEATLLPEDETASETGDPFESIPTAESLTSSKTPTAPLEGVQRDAGGFAKSWVLQVATVSRKTRAEGLVKQLQEKGYEAFHQSIQRDGKTLWRVQIGPKLQRSALRAIKAEIDKALNVDARVIKYVQ